MSHGTQAVEDIKELQRTSPQGKQAWWKWADEQGGGVRDPAKHDPYFLQSFLDEYRAGNLVQEGEGGIAPGILADLIKEGQRNAPHFKGAWAAYNKVYGSGHNDPHAATRETIVSFLDFVGKLGEKQLGGMGPQDNRVYDNKGRGGGKGFEKGGKGGQMWVDNNQMMDMMSTMGQMMNMMGTGGKGDFNMGKGGKGGFKGDFGGGKGYGGEPAAKRAKGGPAPGGGRHEMYVNKIKALQRTSEEEKQKWIEYSRALPGGMRDPARHSEEDLKIFCDMYGL